MIGSREALKESRGRSQEHEIEQSGTEEDAADSQSLSCDGGNGPKQCLRGGVPSNTDNTYALIQAFGSSLRYLNAHTLRANAQTNGIVP